MVYFLRLIFFIVGFFFWVGCSGPYLGKDQYGADEFVLDSYKIREGKFSILELQGESYEELDEALLEASFDVKEHDQVELAGVVKVSSIPLKENLRLFDCLSLAQISSDANLFKSYVSRDGKMVTVDLNRLLRQGDMSQNIAMRGGDKIFIAEASSASVTVMGEVAHEGEIDLPQGSISLRQALAKAGGIVFTGDKSYIQIIRGNLCQPKIYTLNWEHVLHLPNDSLLLMPGDMVYVATRPITEWNRFISQLLPFLAGSK